MFVLSSKYKKLNIDLIEMKSDYYMLQENHDRLIREKNRLAVDWNNLIRKVNNKGGEAFLDGDLKPSNDGIKLNEVDIKRLLSLCHPDKHGGKKLAVDMTQKLLEMRNK